MSTPIDELIARLDSADAATRLDAATRIRDMAAAPPPEVIPTLIAHLDDAGHVDEEWTDWTGSACGGTTHHVASRMLDALVRLGTPAFIATVAAVAAGRSESPLYELAVRLPMDALVAAGHDVIAHARRIAHVDHLDRLVAPSATASTFDRAAYVLAWANDELSRSDPRVAVLGRRLTFTLNDTATLAARELGTVEPAHARRAAELLADELVREPAQGIFTQAAAAASLDRLGPVLDSTRVARLVAATPTRAMFYCWPELLPAIAAYGDAARDLGPWLLSWLRDDKPAVEIGNDHLEATRRGAALALARLGTAAVSLHGALAEIYAVADDERRKLVLRALPDRSVLVVALGPRWRAILAGSDRAAIWDALDRIRDLEAAAVPLVDAIAPFVARYWSATLAMGKLGDAARPVVPALIRALDDASLCTWACYALRDLGPDIAAAAIAPLEQVAARDRASNNLNSAARSALEVLRRS